MPSNVTIKAIAIASGYSSSAVASATYVITTAAATPAFSVAAGTYTATQSVAISSTTPGASIYYTLDGSTPTTASPLYSAALSVSASGTIKAIAVAAGYTTSSVASAAYVINLPAAATPTASVAAGTYSAAQSVTLSSTTAGAAIRYTLDGSTPTAASPLYTGAIAVAATETISAIAIASGYSTSAVASFAYVISSGPSTLNAVWSLFGGSATDGGGGYIQASNAGSGGIATRTIDATKAFNIDINWDDSTQQGVIVYLAADNLQNFGYGSTLTDALVGCYEFGGAGNRFNGAGGNPLTVPLAGGLPVLMRMTRSGNDVVVKSSYDGGTTWAVNYTDTGILSGQGTLYLKAAFAAGAGKVKVVITQ